MNATHDPIDWLYGLQSHGIKLGLAGIRALLAALDRPDRAYPVLLVGGTNGKGSVAAMLDALLRAHGLRVGLTTSPHLVRPEERIRVDGADVSRHQLERLLTRVREVCTPTPHPSFFEVITAAACLAFRDARVDVAVLEVGLGGRLDATNATEPVVSTIVSIDLDHVGTLGTSLDAIAREKVEIARRGRTLVSGVSQPEALAVIRARCAALSASFADARSAVGITEGIRGAFALNAGGVLFDDLRLPLEGAHQRDNARVALATFLAAAEALKIDVDSGGVRAGFSATRWPGRLQLVPGAPPTLLDGAHNPAGAEALARHLEQRRGPKPVLVFAAMQDKDVDGLVAPLLPHIASIVATAPAVGRAIPPAELAERLRTAESAATPAEALARARVLAGPDGLVLVAGSLYLVGTILGLLEGRSDRGPVAM